MPADDAAAVAERWPALAAATRATRARVPFRVAGRRVGSVARDALPALQLHRDLLTLCEDGVELAVPAEARDAALAQINAALREQGLIVAWRDEVFALVDPHTRAPLASLERAATRFWGSLTFGAHATGFVAGGDGRPSQLWIAQRASTKATDPGLHDNLVGGGVAQGQTPLQALTREAWEEAGLAPAQAAAAARPASVIELARDIPEGFQHEWLHAYDLELPAGWVPANQDGEVAAFTLLPVADALALAAGPSMTVDAALVTLDFALRHGLITTAAEAADLALRLAALRVAQA